MAFRQQHLRLGLHLLKSNLFIETHVKCGLQEYYGNAKSNLKIW
jgi:hypothetical protein